MMRKSIILLLLAVITPGIYAQKDDTHDFNVAKNLDVFNSIYKYLDMMYVDTLDADEVIGNGINGMLRSLDPYTVYYPEDKVKELNTMITGKYAGIGSLIRYNNQLKRVIIDEPYENMPAAEAGVRKGDIILSIDGESMEDKDVSYVSEHLRGDPGTTFALKVRRPSSGNEMTFKITRKAIQLPSVPYYGLQPDSIGLLNLNSFTEGCAKEVRNAFIDMKNQGMRAFVLDLRGNGGGSLSEAVNIVNMFVPKGLTIVRTVGKLSRANHEYTTTMEPIDTVMPIVVLVNGETASASEITSGSLQDLDRAVILGTRTYGKGLVQMPVEMPYNGNLKLTTSKYYIPSGRCIQALNYKHSKGGYTEHVADSLTSVFHTAGGREVRDGGGIMPDIELQPDSMPNIAYYLSSAGRDSSELMLNYELDYIQAHPQIAPARDFQLTDSDYDAFKQRVLASNFTYDPETEKLLKNLVKLAKFEGYYDDAKEEFDNLEHKLRHDLARDLDFNKRQIKMILESDIVAAYHFQAGAIENSLRHDKQFKRASELLHNPQEYNKILKK